MEFFRQEYWRGLPFPPSGDLPDPGIEPMSPALAGGFLITEPFRKPFFWGKDVNEAQHQAGLQMDCVLSAHSISSDAQQSKTEEGKMPLFLSPPQTTTTTTTHTHTHTHTHITAAPITWGAGPAGALAHRLTCVAYSMGTETSLLMVHFCAEEISVLIGKVSELND